MVGVDEALERILAAVSPLDSIQVPILDALDLILAEDVVAGDDIPPFRNSAMDGYAVRAADTVGADAARPTSLRVIGQAAAGGIPTVSVTEGTAIRIMTGAPLPGGADAVVRFEETCETSSGQDNEGRGIDRVAIGRPARPGENVRPAGEDVGKGETPLRAGMRLRPPEIGLLAALGRTSVAVHRRPRVAILSTGDEVADVGASLQPGQIHDSNSSLLAAMTTRFGGDPVLLGIARDSIGDLRARLESAHQTDFIVTSGGVSLGDYDVVKEVLQAEGEIAIWQVRMKPGKPLAFGRIGGTPLLGLPGNPVAAAVSFEQFGRPAILKMLGRRNLAIPTVEATLLDRVENRGRRRHFVRVIVEGSRGDGYSARIAGDQGAGILTSLTRANGLLVVPEHMDVAEPGMRLPVQMTDWDSR
ncbi:MAG: molybdopterin molybdotransferase [Thermomicrobiales bacterium]|nr:molybdopterin molybdotransferase [Thermomicrobiales bacterium]